MCKIAVIAGTNIDTKMGCDLLETSGYKSIFLPISEDCDTQAKLQYFSKKDLQTLFDNACKNAINLGASKIFLYCNSLSSSIDYTSTSKKYSIPIITPLETYKNLPTHCKNIAILCANGVSSYNIDNIILKNNTNINTMSIGNMSIVQMIEKKISPTQIIEDLNFKGFIDYLENIKINEYKIDTLLLGCTHFPYIKDELQKITKLYILDPSSNMIDNLK
jgi:asp/glu/hydantoin family racemase